MTSHGGISRRISDVRPSGIREIFDLAENYANVISLGIGEPDFKTPDFVNSAAKRAIDEGFDKYTANKGLLELREEISKKLKRENRITADPKKEILVTAGATQAIFLVMGSLLDDGDEVLIPTPAFPAYEYSVLLSGGKPVEIPLDRSEDFCFDFDNLEKNVSERTKVIILNSPCNPTGVVHSEKEINRLAEFALEHALYLLSDEIYEKYLYGGAKHYSPASRDEFRSRVITINGFSKTYSMTGWRLAYAAANEEIISAMTRLQMYDAVCANSIAQKAGIAALKGGLTFFDPILKNYDHSREIVCKYLNEMSLPFANPVGAFYVFPNISAITKSTASYCKQLLMQEQVATAPGASFGKAGENHIRLSYSTKDSLLAEAMERMKKFNRNFAM